MNPRPGLYVHVPFCSAICPYCDFAVVTGASHRRERYVRCLLRELDHAPKLGEADTLYFGGGTPSLLEPDDLVRIRTQAPLDPDARVFLEANPEDVDAPSVAAWRRAGVATLSLGIQSFDDEALAFLGRRHTAADARRAVEHARGGGFETVSLDLIFGLPGQSRESWRAELERAVELEPDHLSCYQLTFHDGTLFGRRKREGKLAEMGNDDQAALFREMHLFLSGAGYDGYEVSNFARGPEHRSRHNEKYWDHTPYIGVGPSAHGFDGRTRYWNARSLFSWQKRLERGETPVEGSELLQDDDLLLELVMLRFRTRDGLDLEAVEKRFGCDLLEVNRELVERYVGAGFVVLDGSTVRPTIDGLAVADSLASALELPSLTEARWQRTHQ